MGGIGDILMMTPGLRALARKHAPRRVYFATQRSFLPLFEGNPDVVAVDIEDQPLPLLAFRRWYNLTDCPAARVESRTLPRVKRNRIDIFGRAMGVSRVRLWRLGRIPVYTVTPEEAQHARAFVAERATAGERRIAVHLFSADTYKDYPSMPALVEQLTHVGSVFLFHSEPIQGFDADRVVKVDGLPLRLAVAVAAECDLVIAPDSAFVHIAAALGKPVLALYGPTDGRVFTRRYPLASHLDARKELPCVPCWRNESIACALTQGRRSACMRVMAPEAIARRARELLERPSPRWWRTWLP
jgi:ADP-heptose:LPS heptosyltransferase